MLFGFSTTPDLKRCKSTQGVKGAAEAMLAAVTIAGVVVAVSLSLHPPLSLRISGFSHTSSCHPPHLSTLRTPLYLPSHPSPFLVFLFPVSFLFAPSSCLLLIISARRNTHKVYNCLFRCAFCAKTMKVVCLLICRCLCVRICVRACIYSSMCTPLVTVPCDILDQ